MFSTRLAISETISETGAPSAFQAQQSNIYTNMNEMSITNGNDRVTYLSNAQTTMVSRLAKMKSVKESTTKSGNNTRSPWNDQWSAGQKGMASCLLETRQFQATERMTFFYSISLHSKRDIA